MDTSARLHRQDRLRVLIAIAVLTAASWLYLVHHAQDMPLAAPTDGFHGAIGPQARVWGLEELGLLFVMWAVMMVAMMAPSATPLLFAYARAERRPLERGAWAPSTSLFSGYLLAWTGFAALATIGQWGLHSARLLSPMMTSTSPWFGGTLLVAAGAYQLTPLKKACLTRCRSPMGFLMSQWQKGTREPMRIGIKHGVHCVGCCWLLMALLFVVGVMNLLWVAALATFVLLERTLPKGNVVGILSGVLLIVAGLLMMIA